MYSTQGHGTNDILRESCARSQGIAAFERILDPIGGSPATSKSVAGIINLFVDDLFGTSGTEMEQRVLAKLGKEFHVGSEDWNDVLFTGPSIEVSQERAIEELEEIPVENNTKEDQHCTPTMQTRYRSLLGQINWLQSRIHFQCCCMFTRCAPRSSTPTFDDVKVFKQADETTQVTASETSTLATHKTVENNWIS